MVSMALEHSDLRLPREWIDALDRLVIREMQERNKGVLRRARSRSEFIRQAVKEFLQKHGELPPDA